MTRDFLAIPGKCFSHIVIYVNIIYFDLFFLLYIGTSVPVKRVFSGSTDLITKKRSNLNYESNVPQKLNLIIKIFFFL